MRKNVHYIVSNRRKKRRGSKRRRGSNFRGTFRIGKRRGKFRGRLRMRKNIFGGLAGVDWMGSVVKPVAAGTAGFVAARVIGNVLGNWGTLADKLGADNTRIVGNIATIVATMGLAPRVDIVRRNQGALVTGMGLALADKLLAKVTGPAAAYLSGMGEYFDSPGAGVGEYFEQPLGAYVSDPSMGEYFEQPLSGLGAEYATAGLGTSYATAGYNEGIDPSDQGNVDKMMNVAEAAAGVGGEVAYATAGLGADVQPPFVSIQTPTDMAARVTSMQPYSRPDSTHAVANEAWGGPGGFSTPEGKGYAGGMFARHLFSGMMGS